MKKKRKVIVLIVIVLIWQIVLQVFNAVFENKILLKSAEAKKTYVGNSEQKQYYINTAEDLWEFAELANGGETFKDTIVYITANINLECSEEKQWTPINQFNGEFNGQGHTISGLYISSENTKLGFFYENRGTIRNLNISDSYIEETNKEYTGNIYMGFVAAYNYSGLISDCSVDNSVIKNNATSNCIYIGGICGYNRGIIKNCQNNASVYSEKVSGIGGIVGENYGLVNKSINTGDVSGDKFTNYNSCGIAGIVGSNHSIISLCTNYGAIKSNEITGGIAGTNFSGNTEVIGSCNLGSLEGKYCGGIVGRNGSTTNTATTGGRIINSYNAGRLVPSSNAGEICYTSKKEAEIKNCYYLESNFEAIVNDYAENAEATEKTEGEMKSETFTTFLNLEGKQYEYVNGQYPKVDMVSPKIELQYSDIENNYITVTIKSDEYLRKMQGWTSLSDGRILIKKFFINQELEIIVEDYNYNQTIVKIEIDELTDSVITEENYYINNFNDLQIFAQEVNNGNTCEGKNIYLMNVINIEENYIWDVIGANNKVAFMGNFYGGNHKITGINIEGYSYYKGLFGHIKNANIYNVTVEGKINGESKYTGGIVAYNESSYIEKCINNISINEEHNQYDNNYNDSWSAKVGGIVGYISDNSKEIKISECINNGSIIYSGNKGASGAVGGIAGYMQSAMVSYCTNFANITATNAYDVGGISGDTYLGAIQGCNNQGNITSNSVPQGLGGITGETNVGRLLNNYNMGSVMYSGTYTSNGTASIYNIGGIVGRTYNNITIENCYNIGNSYTGGIVGTVVSTKGSIKNNFSLEDSAEVTYYKSNIEETEIIEKNNDEMKSAEFVDLLNNGTQSWRYDSNDINNGYPYIVKLLDISVTSQANNTQYKEGENFNKEGMKITAIYKDDTREVTDYIIINGTNLTTNQKSVGISYTENGITRTAEQKITVEHDYEETITPPSCTKEGYTTHTCTKCKYSYKDNETEPLGHKFTNYISNNDATCIQDGSKTAKCDRCDITDTQTEEGSMLPHNYNNGVCKKCGEKEEELEITSNKYKIENIYISKIKEKTSVKTFKENIQTNATEIKVYRKTGEIQEETNIVATGMKIELKYLSQTKIFTLVVAGDVDGNGEAKFSDMSIINRHRLNRKTLEGEFFVAGDVNEDGKVDFKDLVRMNRFRLQKITEL